jgi:type III restriction enzyme
MGHRVVVMTTAATLDMPILNGPYDPPGRHFVVGPNGPTGEVQIGRRPSESWIPVPVGRKGSKAAQDGEQQGFDFDVTGERRETNSLINDIRARVELWRARGYIGVTPVTRKLLQHWADPSREDRMLFCQREAAETAIFLAEVAGRHGEPDFRTRVEPENRRHNVRLTRQRQDRGDGNAHRLAGGQQGVQPPRCTLHEPVPGGGPGHHDP